MLLRLSSLTRNARFSAESGPPEPIVVCETLSGLPLTYWSMAWYSAKRLCLQYGFNRIKSNGELFPVQKALIPGFVVCLYFAQKASELYTGTLLTYVSVSSGPDICPVRGCSATSATELEVARGRIRWSSRGGRPLAPARRSNACQPKPSNRFEKPLQLLPRLNRMNAMSCSQVCVPCGYRFLRFF